MLPVWLGAADAIGNNDGQSSSLSSTARRGRSLKLAPAGRLLPKIQKIPSQLLQAVTVPTDEILTSAVCCKKRQQIGRNIMSPNPEHHSFDPAETAALVEAFEAALQALGLSNRQNDLATMLVAKIVIELAEHGETDPHRLRDEAVKHARKRLAWFGSRTPLANPRRH
jgi:hypothetical protein